MTPHDETEWSGAVSSPTQVIGWVLSIVEFSRPSRADTDLFIVIGQGNLFHLLPLGLEGSG